MTGSPWGTIDNSTVYAPGFKSVGTPGHGGIMITQTFANANLSEAARKRGERYGEYLCYEEDCKYAIPFLELLEQYGDKMYAHCNQDWDYGTQEKRRAELIITLSHYYPDYLLETGVTPEPEAYGRYLMNLEETRLRKAGSPDLVICACGSWHEKCRTGEVIVTTADGKDHFVTEASYDCRNRGTLNLLSCYTLTREVE